MDYKDCRGCDYLSSIGSRPGNCVLLDKPYSEVDVCPELAKEPINEIKFEIYFSDLNVEAQKQFLQTFGDNFIEEGNYDTFPIAEFIFYKNPDM